MENKPSSFPPQPQAPLMHKRVGRFYLTEQLGNGANGSVFRGHDPVIDRGVAIKLLNTNSGTADKKSREQQFINEARAAGRLSHPNIVTIFDASTEGGITFIAMELLPGEDLKTMLANGKNFDIVETASIIQKIADALSYAHAHGVIHRDIKPGNIFILSNNQPKVVDFGIARAPNRLIDESKPADVTLFNNNILGTPNYMSPEQALGKPVNAQTDIYSLGAVMYEMLTLQKPFQSNNIDKLLQQIAHKTLKPPSEINPRIPSSLSKIVMKAMDKDLNARYANAEALSLALHHFIERDKRLKRKRKHAQRSPAAVSQRREKITSLTWISLIAVLVGLIIAATMYFPH